MSTRRKGYGRQKIEMKKMSNESHLQVTFTKRRGGLFKKASELSTLCGVDVALVIFSPSEKVFSFGHPHVDTVIDRYQSRVQPQNDGTMQFIETRRSANVRELNNKLTEIKNTLEIGKKFADGLSHLRKGIEAQFWWACPIDEMNTSQLELFKKALEELKKLAAQHANRLVNQSASTQTIPVFDGNVSNSNMPFHHTGNSRQASMFQPQFIQNHMMQPHLPDFNNMGGNGGYTPSGFF